MQTAHPDAAEYASRRAQARSLTWQADGTTNLQKRFDLRAQAAEHADRAHALWTKAAPEAWRQITTIAVALDKDRNLADAAEVLRRADLVAEAVA